ncbi:MAG TPA: hypothetical protein VE994_02050 [Terriglobales bacterium]|nr:hypothetical protein [Terriglobales bacterium]
MARTGGLPKCESIVARKFQSRSLIAQAPGPRGSPQLPQGPADGIGDALELFVETAKTDNCGSSFLLWQEGHSAFSDPYTKASNWRFHCLQMYSKIGMRPTFGEQPTNILN